MTPHFSGEILLQHIEFIEMIGDPRRREADGEILASYLEKLRGLGTRLKDAPEYRCDQS